jgi:hypothetical protein
MFAFHAARSSNNGTTFIATSFFTDFIVQPSLPRQSRPEDMKIYLECEINTATAKTV